MMEDSANNAGSLDPRYLSIRIAIQAEGKYRNPPPEITIPFSCDAIKSCSGSLAIPSLIFCLELLFVIGALPSYTLDHLVSAGSVLGVLNIMSFFVHFKKGAISID